MLYSLQLLRAVAAYGVLLYHLGDAASDRYPTLAMLTAVGACGVDVFFVISGFIMVHTTRSPDCTPSSFLARRLQRVAPPYWFITLVVFIALLVGLEPIGNHGVDWGYLLASLAFVPTTREGGAIMPLLGVGWTLNYEILFYVLFAGVLRWRRFAPPGLLVAIPIATLVALGAIATFSNPVLRTFTSPLMFEFLLGACLGQAWQVLDSRVANWARWLPLGLGLGIMGPCILALSFSPELLVGEASKWRSLTVGVPATLLVAGALLSERGGWVLKHEAILHQGNTSYALYLTHTLVLQATAKLFPKLGMPPSFALESIANIAVCAAAAAVFYRWFEQPLVALAKTAFAPRSAAAPIA